MSTLSVLVDAWVRWDEKPGEEARAKARIAAVNAHAAAMGWDPLEMRRHMTVQRRTPLPHASTEARPYAECITSYGQVP